MTIYSMTAFAHARVEHEHTLIQLEMRSVNNRYLDLHLRMPDELRFFEPRLREMVAGRVRRGKLELRMQLQRTTLSNNQGLAPAFLEQIKEQLSHIRAILPDTAGPSYEMLLNLSAQHSSPDQHQWQPVLEQLLQEALDQLRNNKQREGARLAQAMQDYAEQMSVQIERAKALLPQVMADYQNKVAQRLRESLEQASPEGLQYISGEELGARLAQEASLFSMRIDVAEELTRLEAHVAELGYLLGQPSAHQKPASGQRSKGGSLGKRLDFLCQEMNREANTLGSKAGAIELTQIAIELKLLIEQLREQAQNIE